MRPKKKPAPQGETFTPPGAAGVLPDTEIAPVIVAADEHQDGESPLPAGTTHAQRVTSYHAAHAWHGQALQPFAWKRRCLFEKLRVFVVMVAVNIPRQYDSRFAFEAGLILWLCSSSAAELAALQHDAEAMLAAVDVWAEKHIGAGEDAAAGELAWRILWEKEDTLAVPRVEKGGKEKLGN